MKHRITFIAVLIAIFFSSVTFAQLVTSGADDGTDGTLRNEIADTPDGGTITFAPSVLTVTLNSELLIDKDLTITGTPVTNVTIDANSNGRVFNITAGNVTLNNLTITNGLAFDGGGIYMTNSAVTINNSIITNNIANGVGSPAGSGGGIFNDIGGVLVINNSEISNNTANRAGGGIEDKTGTGLATTLNNVDLLNNNAGVPPATAAPGNGGGIHVSSDGSVNITGGTATGNIAALEGGALWNGFGTMTVDGMTIDSNDAQGNDADTGGGGIYNNGGALVVTSMTTITNNTASGTLGSGGGIFSLTPGTLSIDGLTIENNTANRAGGGIEINSAVGETYTFNNVSLFGNVVNGPAPGNGGGFHITGAGDVVYNGGTVSNNVAFEGGGLWNSVGSMSINGTTITGNTANGDVTGGGGLFNNGGTLNVDAVTTLTGNVAMAVTPGGRGGAIFNSTGGTLNVASGSTISGNYASRAGGAIEDASNGMLILDNVTLTGNSAGVDIGLGTMANPGNGGGIHLSGTTSADILNSDINSNLAAQEGGGLWNNMGTMTVSGSTLNLNEALGNDATDGGGGVFNNGGTLVLNSNTQITNNSATGSAGSGGGVFSTAGSVTIDAVNISNNDAVRAGGGIEAIDGTLTITNTTLNSNTTGAAPGNGGGLHITGVANANITGGTVNFNTAAREGGGLWNGSGVMTVDGTTIDGNVASGAAADDGGGGIFNNGGTLNVQNNTTISNNIADGASGSGGGILTIGGTVMVDGSSIVVNQANRAGGGIEHAGGTLNLTNVTLNSNNAGVSPAVAAPGSGGGLHVSGAATTNIIGGTTNSNIAANEGGGLWNGSGVMTIIDHSINSNVASGNDAMTPGAAGGGGVYNEGGTVDISGTTAIANNIADGAQSTGGGILNASGIVTAIGTTIVDNQSNRAGGGIETNGFGSVTLTNVTLNSNDTGVVTGPGAPGNGGGLHVSGSGTVDVTGSTINVNTAASEGGGLWNGSGTMTVDSSTLVGNDAQGDGADNGGGGLFNNGGTLIVQNNTTINGNTATGTAGSGGGIQNVDGGTVNVSDSFVIFNTANRAGGGIEDNSTNAVGTVTLTNVSLNDNSVGSAPGNGGGFHITGPGNATVTGGTVNNNFAVAEGGGLWNGTGTMTVDGSIIDNNTATGASADQGGGGIFNAGGTIIVQNGTLIVNNDATGAAGSGGGLLSTTGDVTVTDSTFDGNSANRAGGAIELIDGNLMFMNSVMSDNDVDGGAGTANPGNGGGFHVTGTSGLIAISTSTITGNAAANEGGGLWNQNGTTMNVSMSTIDGNSAASGAGIYNNTGAITTVMTSTISGNVSSGSGGGARNDGATLEFNAVTIANNTALGNGGGVYAANNVAFKNSIVALNTGASGNDVFGTLTSNDYNLIGTDDLGVFTPQANDIEGADPVLGPLQDNGGTTLTHQLLNGSPAFDAGDPVDTFVDQIGQPVFGLARDIGAYESQVALSIDEFNEASVLSIYPNPTKGQFNIVIDDTVSGSVRVQIVSMTGKLVKELSIGNGINQMDISGMTSGIYIVNINSERGSATHKLILD